MCAVDPACQGQGLCGRLLRELLALADAEGLPCYLEASGPRAVAIFARVGFRRVGEAAVDARDGAAPFQFLYAMVRPGAGAPSSLLSLG